MGDGIGNSNRSGDGGLGPESVLVAIDRSDRKIAQKHDNLAPMLADHLDGTRVFRGGRGFPLGSNGEQSSLGGFNEEDDPVEESKPCSYTPSSESIVEDLKIDENKKINTFLDDSEDSNIYADSTGETPYSSGTRFEDFNLSSELLKGLYVDMKFQKPSKIQAISLPMILNPPYKDLIAQAHSGSGKTTCFVLGMLSRVDPNLKAPQALCICPTRELALQNMAVLRKMGKYTEITSECAVPMDSTNYISVSKRAAVSAQIVIGTPGTIKKWMSTKKLAVNNVKILAFNEADHMLVVDGFKDDSIRIKREIERSSRHCQVLLFSATFNETVKNFAAKMVKDCNQLFMKKEELALDSVKQYKVFCPDENTKMEIITEKIFDLGEKLGQRIIFVRTKDSASKLHKHLVEDGYAVTSIQGAINREDRDKIVREFRDGLTQVLITNDLIARGFDQQEVNLVINYVLPAKCGTGEPDYEIYMHRIGRAGRFGRKGAVFNLICDYTDEERMKKFEEYFQSEAKEVKNDEDSVKEALEEAGLR